MEGVGFRESFVIRWINGRRGERAMRAGDPDVMSGDSSDRDGRKSA
jgi:hypothetical protein